VLARPCLLLADFNVAKSGKIFIFELYVYGVVKKIAPNFIVFAPLFILLPVLLALLPLVLPIFGLGRKQVTKCVF
jgi:hypothetical protein